MTVKYTLEKLSEVAQQVLSNSKSKIYAFYAPPMGAGKTTLIKSIVKELGGLDPPGSSPTFGIVNEYQKKNGALLGYHFDFYRLNDEMEALDLGLDDYLNNDCYIFIEWPEKIPSLLPADVQEVIIEIVDHTTRKLQLK